MSTTMETVMECSQQMNFITILAMCLPIMAISLCGLLFKHSTKHFALQRHIARLYNTLKYYNCHCNNNYPEGQQQQQCEQEYRERGQQLQQQENFEEPEAEGEDNEQQKQQYEVKQQLQQLQQQQTEKVEVEAAIEVEVEVEQQHENDLQVQDLKCCTDHDSSSDSGVALSACQDVTPLQQLPIQSEHQQQQSLQKQQQQQQRNNQRKLHGSNYSRRAASSNNEDSKIISRKNDLNSSSSNEDLLGATILACKRRTVHMKKITKNSQKTQNKIIKQQQKQQKQQQQLLLQQQEMEQSQQSQQEEQQQQLQQLKTFTSNNNKSTSNLEHNDDETKENCEVIFKDVINESITTTDFCVTLKTICTKTNVKQTMSAKVKASNSSISNDIRSSSSSSSSFSSLSLLSLSSTSLSSNSNSPLSSSNSSSNSSPIISPISSSTNSPTNSPIIGKRNNGSTENMTKILQALPTSLRSNHYKKPKRYTSHISERQLYRLLEKYIVKTDDLPFYGFPVESQHEKGCVEIYKLIPKHMAKEYTKLPDTKKVSYYCHYYGNKENECVNLEECMYVEKEFKTKVAFITPDLVEHKFTDYTNSRIKSCMRCQKMFSVSIDGEYSADDICKYHRGRLSSQFDGKSYVKSYSCCNGDENSEGCIKHEYHIWSGLLVGMNGPYKDFVYTKVKNRPPKVYALDCEMCYTSFGAELTKITIVAYNGKIIYDHYVLPQSKIIDYCTRYSGVSESDLFSPHSSNEVKTFNQVQEDILELFDVNTILIGHGLENDLRALRLVHKKVVDTSIVFSHTRGYPYRQSLKNLTKSFLKHDIQDSEDGHCSQEDALATLNLMLWKVQEAAVA